MASRVAHADAALGPALLAARSAGCRIGLPVALSYRPDRKRSIWFRRCLAVFRAAHAALGPLYRDIRQSAALGKTT